MVLVRNRFGHPLDVPDHPATLATTYGRVANLSSSKTIWPPPAIAELAGAHRHTEVGVLERQHVVDPVARHRHRMTLRLQGTHHGPLLVAAVTRPKRRALLNERRRIRPGRMGSVARPPLSPATAPATRRRRPPTQHCHPRSP